MKSLREKALLAAIGMLVLYALAAGMWFLNLDKKMAWCPRSWAKAIGDYEKACKNYRDECKLISEKKLWEERYEAEQSVIPSFRAGEATATTWQRKIGDLAEKHHISFSQCTPGTEMQSGGDVLQLPIELKNMECALESLVKFMHELENTEDAGMFDIQVLNVKPSNKKGYLKGSMTIYCAYKRD